MVLLRHVSRRGNRRGLLILITSFSLVYRHLRDLAELSATDVSWKDLGLHKALMKRNLPLLYRESKPRLFVMGLQTWGEPGAQRPLQRLAYGSLAHDFFDVWHI
jgi:hypothetical protein